MRLNWDLRGFDDSHNFQSENRNKQMNQKNHNPDKSAQLPADIISLQRL